MGHRLDLGEPGCDPADAALHCDGRAADDARHGTTGGHTAAPALALTGGVAETGHIRPLRADDIPALVALRHGAFKRTESESPSALAGYFESLLLGDASGDGLASSLVFEDGSSHLAGFVGIVPRKMAIGRTSLRVGVATQLMVAPGAPGLVGRRLARAVIGGPFDLILADAANDAARRLWEAVGGRTAVAYSLVWRRALRPLRALAARRARGAAARITALAARPFCVAGDAILGRALAWREGIVAGDVAVPFDIAQDFTVASGLLRDWPLHPVYDPATLRWILDEVSHKGGRLPWQLAVRSARGRLLGWAIYTGHRGGCGEVVQLVARRGCHARVLGWLYADAYRRGLSELTGRLDPSAMYDLARSGATFTHDGPWMLVHSRHRDVMRAIEDGTAVISRLDGEWWMRF